MVEINHNNKDKTLEISCKLFAEDLEEIINKNYKTKLDLTDSKQQDQVNKFVNDYIHKHLSLNADGKPLQLNYVGFEKDAESAYCYFEVTNVPTLKKLTAVNTILYDFIDKQVNIMHVMVNGERKSNKMDYPSKDASFSF